MMRTAGGTVGSRGREQSATNHVYASARIRRTRLIAFTFRIHGREDGAGAQTGIPHVCETGQHFMRICWTGFVPNEIVNGLHVLQ